ncbi:MAG: hypothetical protein E6040_13065 [Lachnospiraceae bacterium]|nr:hypothetical protein [uncultured Lachnoanaerobaculum sp.]MDU5598589.1 hypothetical protein [Lachnospiraceae bacterium]
MFEYITNDYFETSRKYGFSRRIIKDEKAYKRILNKLYEILLAECSFEKLKKAVGDEEYRDVLLKEYHLI